MEDQQEINYRKIQEAIQFAVDNYARQPSLEEIAEHIHLSPYHFQRVFSKWAGVSPKKFIQYLSLQHAKSLLLADKTAMEAYMEVGLSSSSRLHDLFVQIEGMTPSEFKNKGESLVIRYSSISSPFGRVLVASTDKGICYMAFFKDYGAEVNNLKASFPSATFKEASPDE
ncbi:MAG TPA: helix-turn-helix domain-containing protein, partial [Candidatus Sphingobacterium stercoripullorum]|nr:helix-turn-helix domain-containing protein [Candidatus Sphingobacterium stercoripullorum]